MLTVPAHADRIAELRSKVDVVTARSIDHGVLAFGVDSIDGCLAAGGSAVGGLHEVTGASTLLADDAAATLFIAGIAARFAAASTGPEL